MHTMSACRSWRIMRRIRERHRNPARVRSLVGVTAAVVALSFPAWQATAQEKWPTRPIRLLTPFAPGGGSDILARALGPLVSEAIGQTIVVDNRPGGGGTLEAAARS